MLVVKGPISDDTIRTIAGAIVNFQQRAFHYENGVERNELQDYDGYPKLIKDNVEYTFDVNLITVWIQFDDRVLAMIRKQLVAHVEKLLNQFTRLDGKSRTEFSNEPSAHTHIIVPSEKSPTWQVYSANSMDMTITKRTRNCEYFGIYWDHYDMTTVAHNTLLFDFGLRYMKWNDMNSEKKLVITKSKDPLMIEKNPIWKENILKKTYTDFHDIHPNKVRVASLSDVIIGSVSSGDEKVQGICSRCKLPLCGEIYGLYGHHRKPEEFSKDKPRVVPICAICLHSGPKNDSIDSRYTLVLRIDTTNEYTHWDESLVDVYAEFEKEFTPIEVDFGNTVQVVYLTGDSYIGLTEECIELLKQSPMCNLPIMQNRKYYEVRMI